MDKLSDEELDDWPEESPTTELLKLLKERDDMIKALNIMLQYANEGLEIKSQLIISLNSLLDGQEKRVGQLENVAKAAKAYIADFDDKAASNCTCPFYTLGQAVWALQKSEKESE